MKKIYSLIFLIWTTFSFGQTSNFRFIDFLEKKPNEITTFCIPNNAHNRQLLITEKIKIKYQSTAWLFISTSALWINTQQKAGNLEQFYFEFAPPVALNDTTRMLLHVDEVHAGSNGLPSAFTGENVLIGYVDTGVDFLHPDLKDSNGKTRVLRYWDQSDASGINTYMQYGYGRLWDSTAINNGLCTAVDNVAHGTLVVGRGSGNDNANGQEKGMAPNSKIVMVETDFNAANWTLTVADACDYIFKFADSLGVPAAINLSLGTYFGSHDGNDPAAIYMEQLLDEHSGRIIISAAGNAGAKGKFHIHGTASNDTTFVWFLNNPTSSLGANTIYFDLWTETADATNIDFAIGADKPAPNYGFRGKTNFFNMAGIAGTVVYDTIFNSNNDRIATVELYPELINGVYHLEVYLSHVDSTSYYYRFMTKGTGSYDAWSGSWQGLNDMVSSIPNSSIVPEIINYQMPDSLQSIVSSWNCSEKVISVANFKGRAHHTNKNGGTYTTQPASTLIGEMTVNSSRGPSRLGVIKPDISSVGDVGLAAAPLWLLNNSAYNGSIDIDGWHARNGGTSMASPVIAGIAALYLEKCNQSNYTNFKTDLFATADTDQFTGTIPNNVYGYGKPNALNLLLGNNQASIVGSNVLCDNSIILTTSIHDQIDSVIWSNGLINDSISINQIDTLSATIYYGNGCNVKTDTLIIELNQVNPYTGNTGICSTPIEITANYTGNLDSLVWITNETTNTISVSNPGEYSTIYYFNSGCILYDTVIVNQNIVLPIPIVTVINNSTLISDNQINYQWSINGINVIGANSQSYIVTQNGNYNVSVTSSDNCVSTSETVFITGSLKELNSSSITIYPNPTRDEFMIESNILISNLKVIDSKGKETILCPIQENKYTLNNLSSGVYYLEIQSLTGIFHTKMIKM
ncbi:MAG: S8 family peptidase [Flavobacteriia bacterium]|nr:S8 family peptidase [Flavobacteriia bacterium]